MSSTLRSALGAIVGRENVESPKPHHLRDATELRGMAGRADAVVIPPTADAVAAVLAWCYERGVPITPRGGGTGFAGGAVPAGGVVLCTDRLRGIRSFEEERWRAELEAGLRTAEVARLARERGLLFPIDPGAAEQSQLGGNIATNAGGPHSFGYGPIGAWVTGVEAALPPGDLVRVGGPVRKDVASLDLKRLLIGSEGTLGIITSAWLRFVPAPARRVPVVAFYSDIGRGCDAVLRTVASGIEASALEFLEGAALAAAAAGFPAGVPANARFMVLAEADGSDPEATRVGGELREALGDGALAVHLLRRPAEAGAAWRWRDGVSLSVAALRGGKVSEDVSVPIDRLAEMIEGVLEAGRAVALEACSWGHAGDGNVHATFLVDPDSDEDLSRAERAAEAVFERAVLLGGSISGEHGLGSVKVRYLETQLPQRALELHRGIKRLFDPAGLMNPGKK